MNTARILIVEDEPLIAMMLEDFVETLGHRVTACVETVDEALVEAGKGGFDVAILDINLRDGRESWPVADALDRAGLRFVLSSGGHPDDPPDAHRDRPYLAKPFTLDSVRKAIEGTLQK